MQKSQALARGLVLRPSGLEDLRLRGNAIGDLGVIALGVALRGTRLRCLDLAENPFGREGVLALADALRSDRGELGNSFLRELDITGHRYQVLTVRG